MNIVFLDFSLKTLSYDIYLSGCSAQPKCEGCHNPDEWDFNKGTLWDNDINLSKLEQVFKFDKLIDRILIMGGEPLDNDHEELIRLIDYLKKFEKEIYLFTRRELEEVPKEILEKIDYVKTGRYKPELTVENNVQKNIHLATSNQIIYQKGIDY